MRNEMTAALALAGATLSLAACSPPHPHARVETPLKTVTALTCPDREGSLKLQGAASPTACIYTDDQGSQIKLLLVQLDGETPNAALAPFQQAAEAQLPQMAGTAVAGGATVNGEPDRDKADIDLPGIHIHAHGDTANVDVAGVHVNSNDEGEHKATITTHVNNERVLINAGEGGARIHIDENGQGVRSSFMLAARDPGPNGWRLAGYSARGPASGPLVVATMLSKTDNHNDLHNDIKTLLADNVGK